ncbi:hypothetical protein H9P43_003615 [Blastocladiella emersonii ATCC 22665]|nr:hypothetical protein H9P43_003615 [Blastocladiella emersonii ATCC 22665]
MSTGSRKTGLGRDDLDGGKKKQKSAGAGRVAASDWDSLRAMMLPTGFGGSAKGKKRSWLDAADVGEASPAPAEEEAAVVEDSAASEEAAASSSEAPPAAAAEKSADSDDDAEDEDDDEDERHTFPTTHEVHLKAHSKAVTALSLDPAGGRLVTGSSDYCIKQWDFAGMDASLRPFRSFEPVAGQQVVDVQWSTTGDTYLAAPHSVQPRQYDRDGKLLKEFAKGDMYIRDPRHTDGHTAAVTAVRWHPTKRDTFATAGADSTIRVWDTAKPRKNAHVIVFKHGTGARGAAAKVAVTALAYSRDGQWLAGGAADGSVRVWKAGGPYAAPVYTIANAHAADCAVAALEFGVDPLTLYSRGDGDDATVKRWNLKTAAAKGPEATHTDAPVSPLTGGNLALSPADGYLALGLASGRVRILDAAKLTVAAEVELDASLGAAGKVFWHPRIHQLLIATAAGPVAVLYHETASVRGVKLCITRAPRAKRVDEELDAILMERAGAALAEGLKPGRVIQVHGRIGKKQTEHLRGEAKKKPMVPERGKLAASLGGGSIYSGPASDAPMDRDVDPREAILKYAEVAAKDPYWIAPAYKATQPEPVLAKDVLEPDEVNRVIADEDRQRVKHRRT